MKHNSSRLGKTQYQSTAFGPDVAKYRAGRQSSTRSKGFTLIELIAVMVILGILAAMAVPKYLDMADAADQAAATGAVSGGMAQLTMIYHQWKMENAAGNATHTIAASTVAGEAEAKYKALSVDYTLTYAASSTSTGITVSTTTEGGTLVSKEWPWPE